MATSSGTQMMSTISKTSVGGGGGEEGGRGERGELHRIGGGKRKREVGRK